MPSVQAAGACRIIVARNEIGLIDVEVLVDSGDVGKLRLATAAWAEKHLDPRADPIACGALLPRRHQLGAAVAAGPAQMRKLRERDDVEVPTARLLLAVAPV